MREHSHWSRLSRYSALIGRELLRSVEQLLGVKYYRLTGIYPEMFSKSNEILNLSSGRGHPFGVAHSDERYIKSATGGYIPGK